jgi:hypothetical protein
VDLDSKLDPSAVAWRLLNVKDLILKNAVPLHPHKIVLVVVSSTDLS